MPSSRALKRVLAGLAGVAAIATLSAGCSGGDETASATGAPRAAATDEIEGVVAEPTPPWTHVTGTVDYPAHPPSGGDHVDPWVNCGYYETSVPDEMAVHSLEHGAVWIAYPPDVTDAERETLRSLAGRHPYVLVTEYPALTDPFVAVAWERRLVVDDVTDPRLEQFIDAYAGGPDAPEPGAACSGGVGQPE